MPRKNAEVPDAADLAVAASMRPRPDAAEKPYITFAGLMSVASLQ